MAFDLFEALTGGCKLFLWRCLGLFHEGVEHTVITRSLQ